MTDKRMAELRESARIIVHRFGGVRPRLVVPRSRTRACMVVRDPIGAYVGAEVGRGIFIKSGGQMGNEWYA